MIRLVRIPNQEELQMIKDHGLHQALVETLLPDVKNALDALDQALQEDEVSLETVINTLVGLLPAQPALRKVVREVDKLGGSTLGGENGIYVAVAKWIVDNQINKGFDWEASTPPERR